MSTALLPALLYRHVPERTPAETTARFRALVATLPA